MYCKNCGNKLNDGAKFCAKCGNKVEQENSEKTKNVALASEVKLNEQKENVKIDAQAINQNVAQNSVNNPVNNNTAINKTGTNVFALIGFILSLVGILSCGSTTIFGLVLSIVGLTQVNKTKESGKGFAIAGISISSVVVFLWILFFIIGIISNTSTSSYNYGISAMMMFK